MKAKDLQFLYEDYGSVKSSFQGENDYNIHLDRYFNPSTFDTPLSNSSGAVYLKQLLAEIMTWIFPADGSWLTIKARQDEDAEKVARLEKIVRRKVQASNFYLEVAKLINNILIYNKGYLHSHYNTGLSFRSEPLSLEGFYLAEYVDESSQRGYFANKISKMELYDRFENGEEAVYADNPNRMFPGHQIEELDIVECIVPNRDPFVVASGKKYKWVKLYMYDKGGSFVELKPKQETAGFTVFPIVSCTGQRFESLAESALSTAVILNRQEMLRIDRAEQILDPDYVVGQETFEENSFDPSRGSRLIPVPNQERDPKPLIVTGDLSITIEDIQIKERKLREIFKTDLIERLKVVNVSQFEYHHNRMLFFSFVSPILSNMLSNAVTSVMERAIKTLLAYDKEVKEANADVELDVNHLATLMAESQRAINYARFSQGGQFFLQVNPESRAVLDTDKVLKDLAGIYGLQEAIVPDDEVAEVREAQAQQLQMQQQQVQDKTAAETENLQAQAEERKGGA